MAVDQIFVPVVRRGVEWLSRNRLPQVEGTLKLNGLQSRVEIVRDTWGVPHIYAENEHDLFFAQGFVHGQDRFWQMEFQRRLAAGRLSEIFGPLAVSVDRWMRILGIREVAEAEVELAYEDECAILAAYCAGVNAYLEQDRLPVEFTLLRFKPEPWKVVDSIAWVKVLNWFLSSNWECELLRHQLVEKLGPQMAQELELSAEESWPVVLDIPDLIGLEEHLAKLARPFTGPTPGEGIGSNNWVLSGTRTTTGKPLLANDMHLALLTPAIWYENHLEGGEYRVTGISLPGTPLVVSGHNGRVAWGFTAGFADTQDLYEEHLRKTEDGKTEYEYRGEWLPAEVRQEQILVRAGEPVSQEVIRTHHGPIINPLVPEETNEPLALCWTSLTPHSGTLHALACMNRAQDVRQFREGMRDWSGPVLNVVFADVEGNIGYQLIGRVPIRPNGGGREPEPGWTGEHDWIGSIPYDELPRLDNPAQGFIVTANNRVAGPEYPYFLGCDYISGDRAERITEMILSRDKLDIAYIHTMQFDQLSPSAQSLAEVFRQARIDQPDVAPLAEMLRNWDGRLEVGSPTAAIYEVLNRQLLVILLGNRLGELLYRYSGKGPNDLFAESTWGHHAQEWLRRVLVKPNSAWFDLGNGEGRDDVLTLALRRTRQFLEAELGPEVKDWSWGQLHQVTFEHILGRQKPLDIAFNRGPYPIGGDGSTIWSSFSVLHDPKSSALAGPPFRFIADLADLDHCWGLLAPGQSGHPGSPHYDDQIDAWFKSKYHPMLFNRVEVIRGQMTCLEMMP